MRRRVAPSILAADFGRLHEQVQAVVDAGAEVIHIDIMDGHFVPTLSMGPPAVAGLRDFDVLLDIHLMIERPERHVQDFAAAGANNITVHFEATPHVHKAVQAIKEAGLHRGRRAHAVDAGGGALGGPRRAVVGAVHDRQPGLGRAGLHPRLARQDPPSAGPSWAPTSELEVDGGIDERTAGPVRRGGRDALRGRNIRVRDRGSRGSLPQGRRRGRV